MAIPVEEITKCSYCDEPVGEARVVCAACNGVYHGDCWAQNQGCVTFGCISVDAGPQAPDAVEEKVPDKPVAELARALAAVALKKAAEPPVDEDKALFAFCPSCAWIGGIGDTTCGKCGRPIASHKDGQEVLLLTCLSCGKRNRVIVAKLNSSACGDCGTRFDTGRRDGQAPQSKTTNRSKPARQEQAAQEPSPASAPFPGTSPVETVRSTGSPAAGPVRAPTVNSREETIETGVKVAAALAYFFGWLSGLVIYFAARENRFLRFHAIQSILVSAVYGVIVVGILGFNVVVALIGGSDSLLESLFMVSTSLLQIAYFILWILLIIRVFQGRRWKLPLIGNIADKRA